MARKTVFASQLKPGDVVDDGNGGSYAQYGAITRVTRKGASFIAETAAGVNLSFGVTNRVLVRR